MRSAIARLGARVTAAASSGCASCGHPLTLHSNGKTACRAAACTAGPDGGPCQGFEHADGHHVPELLAS